MAAFPYALALVMAGGADEILLTGFDGFEAADPRQGEMIEIIHLFTELDGAPEITALTPTNYPVNRSSIYSA
jgi:4-hydroxy 2-oxovalerate aldolase